MLKSALFLSECDFTFSTFDTEHKEKTEKMENNWASSKKSLELAFRLISSFGFSKENFKANNAIIPIAYHIMQLGNPENIVYSNDFREHRDNIKKWLILSLIKGVFGSDPDSVLGLLREILKANGDKPFPLNTIIEKFKKSKNKAIASKAIEITDDDINRLMDLEYGDAETRAVLMLLYPGGLHVYSDVCHVDHIYPKAKFKKNYLKKQGITEENDFTSYCDKVNSLANLQLLPGKVNQIKRDTDFDAWFKRENPDENAKIAYRKLHYLPDMEYSYANFLDFMSKREELLKAKLKEITKI